ncbi:MAG: glycosyltransferase family 4 protein [Chloroflexi bacterium]|nr:glycosyltransferase family 4 protein [Chloroflexota bacterium]
MRIALIVPGFSADDSDWCIPALLNLARALGQRVELEIFALRYPPRRGAYQVSGVPVQSLGTMHRRGGASAALWAEAVALIARRHRARHFDLLHAFWADEPAWIGAAAARLLGVPLVASIANGELSSLPGIGYGLQRLPLQRRLIDWALQSAAQVTTGSDYLAQMARARTTRPLSLAPLGVDTNLFTPALSERASGPPTLLNVGSLAPVKGQMTLLEAMRRVVAVCPAARLRIIGEGPLRDALRRAIGEWGLDGAVELCGGVAHDQLPGYYREASLLVQASLHEAQGMAVLEAAACGVPCVGTAVGVVSDLAPDAAVAVPAGDAPALAEAIIQLLNDDARRRALGRRARQRVADDYRVDVCAERFVTLYGKAGR